MIQTRIKICGITRPEDARAASASGVDAIGLVFYPPSPRAVTAEQAAAIVAQLSPFVSVVALFVDERPEEIERILSRVPVDIIQFHGDETPEYCRQFNRPWMKALRVNPGVSIEECRQAYEGARAILLDSWQEGVPGGTGRTFDWSLAQGQGDMPLVLAGGLNEDNVGQAIAAVRPCAVDVSGGVEQAPGIKDAGKIERFIAAVKAADTQLSETDHDQ